MALLREDPILCFFEQMPLPFGPTQYVLAKDPESVFENRGHEFLFGLELSPSRENLLILYEKGWIWLVAISSTHGQ